MNTEQNTDIQRLANALRQKREVKGFEVRFQEIRTYRVFVEASNADEADFMAIRELQGNPEETSLIRTEFDFFTGNDTIVGGVDYDVLNYYSPENSGITIDLGLGITSNLGQFFYQ